MIFRQLATLLAAWVCVCDGVQVTVREDKRWAMLFQTVVLQCQYHTASTQTPVVQWWYKSYCRDRTRDAFSFRESLGARASDLGPMAHVECSDSTRTVRVVASGQGPSITLSEHYKGRDISIINKADLRIGELQWGDSGVYFCKVVIANDLEGKNEAQVELLVLGRTGEKNDLLPEFDVEIMPEWVFVGSVVLGSILFLLLAGICWCQCCPHSCCCYISCCCCPDTCCCPRHLYEAGKMAKSVQPPPPPTMYPYYIPIGSTMIPMAPSSHMDPKMVSLPPSVENNMAGVRSGYRLQANQGQDSMKVLYYIEKELAQFPSAKKAAPQSSSLSELSSLHDGGMTDFKQTYQTVQMKALPPIPDLDDQSVLRAPFTQGRRHRGRDRDHHSEDEQDNRWNPRSEHLKRKTLSSRGRTGSLDELEEFARSYGGGGGHARRGEPPRTQQDYDRIHPTGGGGSPPRRFHGDMEDDGWHRRSPSPLPQKRRGTWDNDRPDRPSRHHRRAAERGSGYDDAFLNSVLESKARGQGGGDRGGGGRVDEDSDTPSRGSSRGIKGKGSDCYYSSRSPSNRLEDEDSLPPYSEREVERHRRFDQQQQTVERYRTVEPQSEQYRTTTDPAMRPFSYTRPPPPHPGISHTLQGGGSREDSWDSRNRNMSTALSRDSLIV